MCRLTSVCKVYADFHVSLQSILKSGQNCFINHFYTIFEHLNEFSSFHVDDSSV